MTSITAPHMNDRLIGRLEDRLAPSIGQAIKTDYTLSLPVTTLSCRYALELEDVGLVVGISFASNMSFKLVAFRSQQRSSRLSTVADVGPSPYGG